jgi:hypothetical protein
VGSLSQTLASIDIHMYKPSVDSALGDLLVGIGSTIDVVVGLLRQVISSVLSPLLDPLVNTLITGSASISQRPKWVHGSRARAAHNWFIESIPMSGANFDELDLFVWEGKADILERIARCMASFDVEVIRAEAWQRPTPSAAWPRGLRSR